MGHAHAMTQVLVALFPSYEQVHSSLMHLATVFAEGQTLGLSYITTVSLVCPK